MFRYLKKLKKIKKFRFFYPSRKSILILDTPGSYEISKLIENEDFEILNLRYELNLIILILSILSFKKKTISQKYIETYIKHVNPKILITFIDNNIFFYDLKLKSQNFKKIIIQNGMGILTTLEKINFKKKYDVDFFFVFNENYSKFYKEIIKGRTVIHGSLKNNLVPVDKNSKKNYDILFISQFRDKKNFNPKNYSWESWYKSEKELIKTLNKFCFENKKKLTIAGFFNDKIHLERIFYENILKNERNTCQYTFLAREGTNQTYKLMDQSNLIITIDSAIGYEGLARDCKVLFLSLRSYFLKNPNLRFGWPKNYSDTGEFWINNFDSDAIEEKIKFMLNVSKNDWNKIKMRYIPELMCYDVNNFKLKQLLNQSNVQ
jgi:surface carbohydrate biosynthesis protein